MKKTTTLILLVLIASLGYSQSFKDKMAAKMAGGGKSGKSKAVEPPEGEYSDPSGLSGTYYATSDLPYLDTKKMVEVVKLEFVAADDKLLMHSKKGDNPDAFVMEDWMKYARDNAGVSQFRVAGYSVYTVEPGVVVFGYTKRSPKDYPGHHQHHLIGDTTKMPPVILVKDQSLIEKYSYADAKRILSQKATACEISNVLRLGQNNNMPGIGTMTSDKVLVERSVGLMKEKWASSKDPERLIGAYIHNNDWAEVQYGKLLDPQKTTYSDEVTAIMIFKDEELNLHYYYAIGVSRHRTDITGSGVEEERGLTMTGNSRIQYVTEEKVKASLAQLGQ